jgi:hypothetical protein
MDASRADACEAEPFSVSTAVLAAGFAFEAYNEPSENDARWERGVDGIDVAFMSDEFAREVYHGILEVRLCEAKELTTQEELVQALFSGSERDPYVVFAMNEENEQGPKEGAIGLGRAVDRVRSSTAWSKSLAAQWTGGGRDKGAASWPEDERHYLYVKEPTRAQLALTVFDEEVGAARTWAPHGRPCASAQAQHLRTHTAHGQPAQHHATLHRVTSLVPRRPSPSLAVPRRPSPHPVALGTRGEGLAHSCPLTRGRCSLPTLHSVRPQSISPTC